jgi:3-oxoacyl-[acyl-carrier-protein] synthase II
MSERRVVITGMGWVTPLGEGVDDVWSRLVAGTSAIGPVTLYDAQTFATNFAAEVRDFDLERVIGDEAARHERAGRSTHFALGAAARAWAQAGLGEGAGHQPEGVDPRRIGVYLGAGEGPPDFENFSAANIAAWDDAKRDVDGGAWARVAYERLCKARELEQEPNMTLGRLARAFGIRGPAFNCMTACAASTQAVGEASEQIRRGDADVMLAGGAHSMIHPLGMTGFIRLTAMSTRRDDPATASRPFDATRDGFVMGEGAGIVVIEELEHALKRGATPLAEIAGYGASADAFRITDIQPEGKGAASAMRQACAQAGIDPTRPDEAGRSPVQYVNAHGTGTQENDKIETAAVRAAFGEMADKLLFGSVKSMLGHLIQAAGAVELITCVKAIQTGVVPPTMNLNNPDPRCDLDHVAGQARDLNASGGVDVCLSNSFGFGGQNNTVCVRRI